MKITFWTLVFPLLFICLPAASIAQQWTWMNGDSITSKPAVYGTQGVFAPANHPNGLYEPADWIDKDGFFWIYGGVSTGYGFYSNLWKYDPNPQNATYNQWAWIKGPGGNVTNQPASYGILGVAGASNTPGERFAPVTWTDSLGRLWMFGGGGSGAKFYSDLWMYDISQNKWTWQNGTNTANQPGVYGTKGVPASANVPAARGETTAGWADDANNLWFYGGSSIVSSTIVTYGDLWKYDISINQWTWVSASDVPNATAVYGTKGVASTANSPGARSVYSKWMDESGNFWLFGGILAGNVFKTANDLWRYTVSTDEWTWMSGSQTTNASGVYGSKCTTSANDEPAGSTYENKACWKDECGNFWFFGGNTDNGTVKDFNDLWRYNVNENTWTWISGDNTLNTTDVHGTKAVFGSSNRLGGRMGSAGFKDKEGNFWLFGGNHDGSGSVNYDDLWRFQMNKPVPVFTGNASNCTPVNVDFTNTSTSNCTKIRSYSWNFGDPNAGSANISTVEDPSHLFNTPGSYTVNLVVTGCTGRKDSALHTINVPQNSMAVQNITITKGTSITLSGYNGIAYSWSPAQGLSCTNCPEPVASPEETTTYVLSLTDASGCVTTDTVIVVVVGEETIYMPGAFSPNEDNLNDVLFVYGSQIKNVSMIVFDRWGQKIFETSDINKGWDGKFRQTYVQEDIYNVMINCAWVSGTKQSLLKKVAVIR